MEVAFELWDLDIAQHAEGSPYAVATSEGRGDVTAAFDSEVEPRGKVRRHSRRRSSLPSVHTLHVFLAFVAFGAGSSWIVMCTLCLQLPIWQERFGLHAANRMALGCSIGVLSVPLVACARTWLTRRNMRLHYPLLIVLLNLLSLFALARASQGINDLHTLMAITCIAGFCGYSSSVVHLAHVVTSYENVYIAAMGTGDAAAGALAAVVTLAQRPDLNPGKGQLFGPETFYLLMSPIILLGLAAFACIECFSLGVLLDGSASDRSGSYRRLSALKDDIPCALDPDNPDFETKSVQQQATDSALSLWIPGGCLTRPTFTVGVSILQFWLTMTCWGIGDSAIPYACAACSASDQGKSCVFRTGLGTVFAKLVASYIASVPAQSAIFHLYAPAMIYVVVFTLFVLAAFAGGSWASPWILPAGASQYYVASIVWLMRAMDIFVVVSIRRLLQTQFSWREREGMNVWFSCVAIAANVCGVSSSAVMFATAAK